MFRRVLTVTALLASPAHGDPAKLLEAFPECRLSNVQGPPPLKLIINHHSGRPVKGGWLPPTDKERLGLKALYDALDGESPRAVKSELMGLRATACRLPAPSNDSLHIYSPKASDLQVSLLWRPGPLKREGHPTGLIDPLLLDVPHQGTDGTGEVAAILWAETKARVMVLNGTKKNQTEAKASCQASRPADDAAHSLAHLLPISTRQLLSLYPDIVEINVHGMKGGPGMQLLFWAGKRDFKTGGIGRLFLAGLDASLPHDTKDLVTVCAASGVPKPFQSKTGCPTTNVEQAIMQSSKTPACSTGDGPDLGQTLEIEHGPKFLNGGAIVKQEALAINQAMAAYVGVAVKVDSE